MLQVFDYIPGTLKLKTADLNSQYDNEPGEKSYMREPLAYQFMK